ncbi:MAG: asparagine--tRNA ligase [Caldisphaera sp.]|jgi:asparaginyl-tRNA synthetase|uniref:asparagine--tRNA ligase n=1 Tax=Caldisphaera sp. TaxID=2060322 RepID=UPI000CC1684D|nr:asparagine--tRNA ligase [Caldisphaera sp.]PMP60678.1 MAG: asparagine--tRNA ligase [Caldisphaera sp.]PMP89363.1 MAG: asparagine--tRNA ligase [Caldisphaera sp.]
MGEQNEGFNSTKQILKLNEGEKTKVRGWIYRKRDLADNIFIVVRDSEGIIQTVLPRKNAPQDLVSLAEKSTIESSVVIEGIVKNDERAPGGKELQIENLSIIGLSDDFPIKGGESIDYLLDIRHLWLRSRKLTSIMKIRQSVLEGLREYFKKNNWWEVNPPILTQSAVEGGATLFEVNFFNKKAYLSQSAQFYLEVMIFSLEKVWAITPSFRAEKSRTRRHLYEYYHLEGEAAWMGMKDMMNHVEGLIKSAIKKVLEDRLEDLEIVKRDTNILENSLKTNFPEITYDEAILKLKNKGINIKWGDDIGADEEKVLTEYFDTPFFLTMFPKHLKSFYMKIDDSRPDVVLGFDLEAPEGYGEVVGGSQREDSYEKLYKRIVEEGYNPSDYQWYLDLRKYGTVPHSGYGLGVDRLVTWIAGLDHIRDSIPFPRFRERIYP